MRDRYDVIVIGGGAAGLSGAVNLGRSRRSVLVIDAGDPRNAPADGVHGFLSRDGMNPLELLAVGRDEVRRYGVEVVDGRGPHRGTQRTRGFAVDPRRRHRAPRPAPAGHHRARRRAARDRRTPRALGSRGRALPVLPRLGDPRPGDRRPRHRCTRRAPRPALPPADRRRDGVPAHRTRAHRRRSSNSSRRATSPSSAVRSTSSRSPTTGSPASGSTTGEVVAVDALAVAPRFVARAEVLTSLGLEPTEHPMGIGSFINADPTGATAVPGVWVAGNVADLMAQVVGGRGGRRDGRRGDQPRPDPRGGERRGAERRRRRDRLVRRARRPWRLDPRDVDLHHDVRRGARLGARPGSSCPGAWAASASSPSGSSPTAGFVGVQVLLDVERVRRGARARPSTAGPPRCSTACSS